MLRTQSPSGKRSACNLCQVTLPYSDHSYCRTAERPHLRTESGSIPIDRQTSRRPCLELLPRRTCHGRRGRSRPSRRRKNRGRRAEHTVRSSGFECLQTRHMSSFSFIHLLFVDAIACRRRARRTSCSWWRPLTRRRARSMSWKLLGVRRLSPSSTATLPMR